MELEERLRHIVVDTVRTWPKKLDPETLLRQLNTLKDRIKAACLEEKV